MIEIFAMVREKMPAKLVMIGDGPERGSAEWLVRKKKLTDDVLFLGKQDQVHEKLGLADLFLLPSDTESFGLAALEAMACEVPVIGTNVGGMPEVVTNGVDGYLGGSARCGCRRKICDRYSGASGSRTRDGTIGAGECAKEILRERYYSAV